MYDEKFRWDKKYTLNIEKISESPLIQILPSGKDSNVYVFEEQGNALHVDGHSRKVIETIKLLDHPLVAVESVRIRKLDRFLVSENTGNLYLFNHQFYGDKLDLGRRNASVHSIVDIGRKRALIAYSSAKNVTTIELISVISGTVIDSIELEGTLRIRHMCCPKNHYGKGSVRVLAGSDYSIIELDVNNFKLEQGGIQHLGPNQYIDEVWTNGGRSRIWMYKYIPDDSDEEMHPNSKGIWSHDPDEKLCTISFDHDAKVMTERGKVTIVANAGKYHRVVDIEGEVIHRHIHSHANRILGITLSGKIVFINFRSSVSSFLWDA